MPVRKIPSMVAYPITQNNNQIYYDIPNEQGTLDMQSSYVELELPLTDPSGNTPTDLHNVVFGHDGLLYNPSCLYRQSKLYGTQSHKKLYDMNYINILSNNLEYWTKGKNSIKADSLFNGQGATSYDNNVYSVFNNGYSDTVPVVKVPLSLLYHGSLGQSDMLPQNEAMEMRFLMESDYKCLMRAVNSKLYKVLNATPSLSAGDVPATSTTVFLLRDTNPVVPGLVNITATINAVQTTLSRTVVNLTDIGNAANFADGLANATVLTASALGTVVGNDYAVNQYVMVTYTPTGGDQTTAFKKVTVVTVDAGQNIGSLTLDSLFSTVNFTDVTVQVCPTITISSQLDGANTASNITVSQTVVSGGVACDALQAAGLTLTLTDQTKTSSQIDLYKNTNVTVHYIDASGVYQTQSNKIVSLTLAGENVTTVVMTTQVPICQMVTLEPLYTNLDDYTWQVVNSHIVLYRRNIPMAHQQALLISDYESRNVQCVSGLSKFSYNFKFDNNTYNVYVMTPTNTNLYSQSQNFQTYLMSVNEIGLTSIYIDKDTIVHQDNMVRVLSNSQYNQPKNLNNQRDDEITQSQYPLMYPAKIFQSVLKGELNIQDFNKEDTDLRVEILAGSGLTTPACMVYAFGERFNKV